MQKERNKWHVLVVGVVLAGSTFLAYEPMRHNDFLIYDTLDYVTGNPPVKAGLNMDSVKWAFTTPHSANWHPVTWLSHMLDCELFGLDPFWHHSSSLLIHVINVLLLFWVMSGLTKSFWPSAFVAGVFALHPLRVESVAWVAERKDLLSGFFWILTMGAYVLYVRRPGVGRYLLVALALALGLMAKPMGVTLPFVLLLLDYWPLRRFKWAAQDKESNRRALTTWRLIAEKIPLFALVAVSCVVTYIVQQRQGAMGAVGNLPFYVRLSNALISYISYIVKTLCPINLGVLYPYVVDNPRAGQAIISFLVLVAITVGVFYTLRRRGYLAVGWLWYIGTLVPVIGFIQVGSQAMADRYTYLPMIGIYIMLVWSGMEVFGHLRHGKTGLGITAVVILVTLLLFTRKQVGYWQDSFTLFTHTLNVTKANSVMHNNMGTVLGDMGRYDEAIVHYRRALELQGGFAEWHYNLAYALQLRGSYDEAIEHYQRAVSLDKNFAEAYINLGVSYEKGGRISEATDCYRRAVEIKPDLAIAQNNLALMLSKQGQYEEATWHYLKAIESKNDYHEAYHNLANALLTLGKYADAIRYYRLAIRYKSDYDDAHNNLGTVLATLGRLDEAIEHYRRALQIKGGLPKRHFNLGYALQLKGDIKAAIEQYRWALQLDNDFFQARQKLAHLLSLEGKFNEAVEHYHQVLQEQPNWHKPNNDLAWILATCSDEKIRNPDEAVRLAERACELTEQQNAAILDTLAVAYAAAGEFAKAIETCQKGLDLAVESKNKALAEQMRQRLELYRQSIPYREPAEH